MRRPSAPGSPHLVFQALALEKVLNVTREAVFADAATPGGFECGSKKYRWRVRIWTNRNILRAQLACDGAVVLGLDYHGTPGRISIGYHWDVHPPLSLPGVLDPRIHIQPQPNSGEDALEYLRVFWNLGFIDGSERLL